MRHPAGYETPRWAKPPPPVVLKEEEEEEKLMPGQAPAQETTSAPPFRSVPVVQERAGRGVCGRCFSWYAAQKLCVPLEPQNGLENTWA